MTSCNNYSHMIWKFGIINEPSYDASFQLSNSLFDFCTSEGVESNFTMKMPDQAFFFFLRISRSKSSADGRIGWRFFGMDF